MNVSFEHIFETLLDFLIILQDWKLHNLFDCEVSFCMWRFLIKIIQDELVTERVNLFLIVQVFTIRSSHDFSEDLHGFEPLASLVDVVENWRHNHIVNFLVIINSFPLIFSTRDGYRCFTKLLSHVKMKFIQSMVVIVIFMCVYECF